MEESPFLRKKVELKREQTFLESVVSKARDAANVTFLRTISSEDVQQMPPQYLYPVGALLLLLTLCIFVAVFVPGYYSTMRTRYLAPAGDSKYCTDVPISNTGTYLATQEGDWQGSPTFSYANASYSASITNLQLSSTDFQILMTEIYNDLLKVGAITAKQTLAYNLLYWMSWVAVQPGNNAQRFTLTGTPSAIFNRQHTVGTLSNVLYDCNASSQGNFDPSTGTMTVTYNVDEFLTNPTCNQSYPQYMGYSTLAHSHNFDVTVDIFSLITALAVNIGITSVENLQAFNNGQLLYNGAYYPTTSYVDPRYPGMKPVLCMFPGEGSGIYVACVIQVGAQFAIPLFNHVGSDLASPLPCNCSHPDAQSLEPYGLCNLFSFMTGFLYWQTFDNTPNPILDLMLSTPMLEINRLAFNAMFAASAYGMGSSNRSAWNSEADRRDNYAFCNSTVYGVCSIGTLTSYDSILFTMDVSANYYQLLQGACKDTATTSMASWQQLYEQPFAPLKQQYQTCRNDPSTVLVQQVGASAGNVSILAPFGVMLVLAMLYLYQYLLGFRIPLAYSRAEKDAALDALAEALLNVRDGRILAVAGAGEGGAEAGEEDQGGGAGGVKSKGGEGGRQEVQGRQGGRMLHLLVEQLQQIAGAESEDFRYREQEVPEVGEGVDWAALHEVACRKLGRMGCVGFCPCCRHPNPDKSGGTDPEAGPPLTANPMLEMGTPRGQGQVQGH